MSKKNFTGGLSSLLGDQPDKPKRGRPVTQTKEITKSSQEGTKENETSYLHCKRGLIREAKSCSVLG